MIFGKELAWERILDKILEKNLLFDFYGELLTDHQKRIYGDLLYGDLSLSELAEEYGISRQGIHDIIKRCDKTLDEYENKLHLVDKFISIRCDANDISRLCDEGAVDTVKVKALADKIVNTL